MKTKVGNQAPSFSAPDQKGTIHKLSDYKGRWLILYFYPKDFTSGCTKEACNFRDNLDELKRKATIVGVSADSIESHKKFAAKHKLPFTLLSDPERKIINTYGTKSGIKARRFTYLIDPKGKIVKIYKSVDPKIHADQVIRDIKKLS